MRRFSRWIGLAFLMSSTGCYSLTHDLVASRYPMMLDDTKGTVEKHFLEEDRALYVLFGTVPIYQPKLEDKISPYLRKGAKVANLKFETICTPTDVLLGMVPGVFGILFSSRTVRYEGDVKFSGKGGGSRD